MFAKGPQWPIYMTAIWINIGSGRFGSKLLWVEHPWKKTSVKFESHYRDVFKLTHLKMLCILVTTHCENRSTSRAEANASIWLMVLSIFCLHNENFRDISPSSMLLWFSICILQAHFSDWLLDQVCVIWITMDRLDKCLSLCHRDDLLLSDNTLLANKNLGIWTIWRFKWTVS